MIFLKDAHFSAHGTVLPIHDIYILCSKNILLLLKKWTFFLGPFPPKSLENSPQNMNIQRKTSTPKIRFTKTDSSPLKSRGSKQTIVSFGVSGRCSCFFDISFFENVHPGSLTCRPGKMMVRRLLSFWDVIFQGLC